MAPEHLRALAPDEVCSSKPVIRRGLEERKKASQSSDHVDITCQHAAEDDLQQSAGQPAGDDQSAEPVESVTPPPVSDAKQSLSGPQVEVLQPPEEEAPGELTEMVEDSEEHSEEPGESSA